MVIHHHYIYKRIQSSATIIQLQHFPCDNIVCLHALSHIILVRHSFFLFHVYGFNGVVFVITVRVFDLLH